MDLITTLHDYMKYEARRSQAICNDKFDTTYVRVKLLVFPVFMYGCESWTIKKVEHLMIHAFDSDVGEDS